MKILVISDIISGELDHLEELVSAERPEMVIIAGDILQGGKAVKQFFHQLEHSQIETLTVKGNWDDHTTYDSIFLQGRFRFIHEISEKYYHLNGLTFLGISHSFFSQMKNVRSIQERFPERADFIVTHPPTKRRIWVFELNPDVVLMGHDDLRVCKVSQSLLLTTNDSPENYAILNVSANRIEISYRQGTSTQGWTPTIGFYSLLPRYEAVWQLDSKVLVWSSPEHYCYRPPYAYPAKDSEYGDMLATLLDAKRSKTKAEILNNIAGLLAMKAPKTLIHEFLGISWNELRIPAPEADSFVRHCVV